MLPYGLQCYRTFLEQCVLSSLQTRALQAEINSKETNQRLRGRETKIFSLEDGFVIGLSDLFQTSKLNYFLRSNDAPRSKILGANWFLEGAKKL